MYPTPVREVLPEIASHLNNFPIQLNQSGNGALEFPSDFSANIQSPASIIFSNNQEGSRTTRLASQLFSDIFTRADKNGLFFSIDYIYLIILFNPILFRRRKCNL